MNRKGGERFSMGKSVQTSKGYLGGLYNEKKIKVG